MKLIKISNRYLQKAFLHIRNIIRRKETKPARIVIELTNRCNLNCPYCLVGLQAEQQSVAHSDLDRPLGKMDLALAKKTVKDARDFNMKEVMLTFQGEPLLHEGFVELVETVKQHQMRAVVFTNGLLLTPDLSRKVVRAGLDSVRFSIDGASEETYQVNRVGGTFKRAFANMRDFAGIAREEKKPIEVIWQFIALRNNEREIPRATQMAREINVDFIVKTFAESLPDRAPRNPQYRRKLQEKPCTDIYRMVCVFWNGDVVPCCYDLVGKEIFGNVRSQSIAEIWNSDKYRDFRHRVQQAPRQPDQEPLLCRTCLKWASISHKK